MHVMHESTLLHELVVCAAMRAPDMPALTYGPSTLSYREIGEAVSSFAAGLLDLGLQRTERVGIYLEKRFETVIAELRPRIGAVIR